MKVKIGGYPNYRFYHNWLYDWFGYSPKQKTNIRIDKYDTWSMDHTLAMIIHPMLVQLKETTHGYPSELTEERWNEILDEMIWAFEQKCRDNWEDREGQQLRMTNGFKLFGKYYENLWD
tara:strand:- start:278 stop:634 length:357 start_codon:yes stop_codon:yes gene_type:complete